jgi:branched-chain amino acid aminotransferase
MTEPLVHWNGRLVPADEARVSVFDAGFLYGDGIYETMRAYGGVAFGLDRHLVRLARSAGAIGLPAPEEPAIADAVRQTLAANRIGSALVRVTVTRGRLERRLDLSSAVGPSVLVAAEPFDDSADAVRRRGIRVIYSRWLRRPSTSPLAGVKSTNYQISLFARNEAREAGAFEVLVPDESGDITEAAAANVFLVENGRLVTPPLEAGILAGITRDVVVGIARAKGREIEEARLPRERIEAADEVFLTGTSIEVTPVVTVEDRPVGGGAPGPVTREILAAYLEAVATDTGAPVAPDAGHSPR